jgi:predicted Zn-dependent protease
MRKKALALALLLFVACSTNPVTGKREFNLVSEADELAMGQQSHPEVMQEFGLYDEKPELNALVDRIGKRIAAVSDRPNLPWHFTLLDTPMVNAMALPGGYVYVTRGILERMNSEDELAGVIAHEVSHVAARHSARSISQQQLAQIGLGIASIVAGPVASEAYGGLVQLGAGLLFTRYSRQQETQADLLGTAYMTEAGYNPRGAENMLKALQRLENGDTTALDRYFIDHPDPGKRVNDVHGEINKLQAKNASIGTGPLDRNSFVRRLDGVITSDSTMQTTVRNNTIYNRRYGIILTAPPGWDARAEPGTVFVLAPKRSQTGEAFFAQEVPLQKLQGYANVQTAVRNQLQQMGLQYAQTGSAQTASGQRFNIDVWTGNTQSGQVIVQSTQFTDASNAVVFMQMSPANRRGSDLAAILQTMQIDRARARSAEPPRLRIETTRAGDTWQELARRATGNTNDAAEIAKMNGFDYPSNVPAGIAVKLPEQVAASSKS